MNIGDKNRYPPGHDQHNEEDRLPEDVEGPQSPVFEPQGRIRAEESNFVEPDADESDDTDIDDFCDIFRIGRELRHFLKGSFVFAPELSPDPKLCAAAAGNLTPRAVEQLKSAERARFEAATDGVGKRIDAWVYRAKRCTKRVNDEIAERRNLLRKTDKYLPSAEHPKPLGAMGIAILVLLGGLALLMLSVPVIAWRTFLADFIFSDTSSATAFSFLCLASVGLLDALPYFMENDEQRQKYRLGLGIVGLVVLPVWAIGMALTIGGPLVGEMPGELVAATWVGKAIAVSSLLLEPITCAACIQGCIVLNESRKPKIKNPEHESISNEIKSQEKTKFSVLRSLPLLLGLRQKYTASLKTHQDRAVAEAELMATRFGF